MVSSYGPSLLAPGAGLSAWMRPLALAQDVFSSAARPGAALTNPPGRTLAAPTQDPASAHLGRLVDLRATQRTTVDDTSLTVHTAEGDTITLTAHRETSSLKARLTYAPGDAPDANDPQGPGRAMQLGLREFTLDERVTVSVQGDLSETELADLRKLVGRLGESLHEAGDDEHDGPRPLPSVDMRGLDSIADFSLQVEHTETVTRLHVRRPAGLNAGPGTPPGQAEPPVSPGAPRHDAPSPDVSSAWLLRLLESLRNPAPSAPSDPATPPGPASPAPIGA